MSDLPGGWGRSGRYYEIKCPHGIGHPIPELTENTKHGCDGCCSKESFHKAKQKYLKTRRDN